MTVWNNDQADTSQCGERFGDMDHTEVHGKPPSGIGGEMNGETSDFRSEPGETECMQVIWSEGRSCSKCWVACYRKGWSKAKVDVDNRRLVAANNSDPVAE